MVGVLTYACRHAGVQNPGSFFAGVGVLQNRTRVLHFFGVVGVLTFGTRVLSLSPRCVGVLSSAVRHTGTPHPRVLLFVGRLSGFFGSPGPWSSRCRASSKNNQGSQNPEIQGFSKKEPGFSKRLDLRCVGVLQKKIQGSPTVLGSCCPELACRGLQVPGPSWRGSGFLNKILGFSTHLDGGLGVLMSGIRLAGIQLPGSFCAGAGVSPPQTVKGLRFKGHVIHVGWKTRCSVAEPRFTILKPGFSTVLEAGGQKPCRFSCRQN